MLEYERLRGIGDMVRNLRQFPLPAVITDPEFQVYWSNPPARNFYPQMTTTDGLRGALIEFDLDEIRSDVEDKGGAMLRDVIPFAGIHMSLSPIWDGESFTGIVILLIGSAALPNADDFFRATRTPEMLSGGIRQAVGEVFEAMDVAAHKADLMDVGWVKHGYEQVSLFAYRMLRITDNITEYCRCLSGLPDLRFQTVDLFGQLRRLREAIELMGQAVQIPVEFSVPEGPAFVRIDPIKIEMVLLNILHNALYYTRPDNRVAVRAEKTDGGVQISVEDRGLGIPDHILPTVMQPYVSYDHKQGEKTVGLGLTLAQMILRAHDGRIEIDSRFGEGTTVTVLLRENTFSGEAPLAQGAEQNVLADRFSALHTALADVRISPYQ